LLGPLSLWLGLLSFWVAGISVWLSWIIAGWTCWLGLLVVELAWRLHWLVFLKGWS